MSLVSIVIPAYNCEKTLSRAIESCLNQTYRDVEVIVVEDCSSDNSLSLASKFGEENSNVKVYANSVNRGVSYSRNEGIRRAKGVYITFLDSDDYFSLDKVESELDCIARSGAVGSYSNLVKLFSSGCQEIKHFPMSLSRKDILSREAVPRDIFIRRELLIDKDLFFDESSSLFEDWDWKIKLSKYGVMVNSDRIGTYYVQHQVGLSSRPAIVIICSAIMIFLKNATAREYLYFPRMLSNLLSRH